MQKITLEDGQSAKIIDVNIAQLRALFPDAFTANGVDFDVLRQLLGDSSVLDQGDEKFGLNWHGKKLARQIALTPSTGTLLPRPSESIEWNKTNNIFIEGDNLEVLKLLQKSYAAKVRMIYIDPPYNTGNDLVYPDNFQDNLKTYLRYTKQIDDEGMKLSSSRESGGRLHTSWLNMMYPRLRVARNLLSHDGVICVSIDDRELANLTLIMNEIFGEENFLGRVVRATGTTTGQDSGGLGQSFDYILIYSKNSDQVLNGIPLDEGDERRFQDEDSRGKYSTLQLRKTGNADRREDRPSMFYSIEAPDGSNVLPIGPGGYESRWRFGREKYDEAVANDLIVWKKVSRDGTDSWWPYVKFYLEGRTKRPSPLWDDIDGNKKATIEVRGLLGDKAFNNPKPTSMIKRLCQIVFGDDKSGIVIDFFAGSGTTADAVMQYNVESNSNLKFIMVQLPEPIDGETEDQRIALKTCETLGLPKFLSELTKERIRRSGQKILEKSASKNIDVGFRVFKLSDSNIKIWNPDRSDLEKSLLEHASHLVSGRLEADILAELLLKRGIELTAPIDQRDVGGKEIFSVGYGVLFACFAQNILASEVEMIAKCIIDWHTELDPETDSHVFFRDSAFADDIAKTNMAAILEQNGISHVRSL
jgi:adenine-specific DNA-methyltransferase